MEESKEKHGQNTITVTVVHVPTSRKKELTVPKNTTLNELLDLAYKELNEPRQPSDTYFCKNGASLANELSKTVQAVISSICKEATIEIRNDTGGAVS